MTIEQKLDNILKRRGTGFQLLHYHTKLESLYSNTYGCKAYLWDKLQDVILSKKYNLRHIYFRYKKGNNWNDQGKQYLTCLERIHELEAQLGFKKTKYFKINGGVLAIRPQDLRWFSCVELFSLYLSAIRYYNHADTQGVYLFKKNPKKLITRITKLDQDYTKNWQTKKPSIYGYSSIHGEGINSFYSNYYC